MNEEQMNEIRIQEDHDSRIAGDAIVGLIVVEAGIYAVYKLIKFAITKTKRL